jgi:hypothetical protein
VELIPRFAAACSEIKRGIVMARSEQHVIAMKHQRGKTQSRENAFPRRGSINTFGILRLRAVDRCYFEILDALRSG